MRMLILGGTVFLGRALVHAATAQGHAVTILCRGRSGPDPEGVEVLRGDRDHVDGLRAVEGREFDVVVDTERQAVSRVQRAVEDLGARTGLYVYTSTVSVYRDFSEEGITEESPTVDPLWPHSDAQEEDLGNYPALNVSCERVVLHGLHDRALVVRPGLIVGPHDRSDRFGYWPARLAAGGTVLAPGAPDRPVQFIDVRDLAEFVVRAAEERRTGVYNACGPESPPSMEAFLEACRDEVGAEATFVWADDAFLTEHEVRPYVDAPLWIPDQPDLRGFSKVDTSKAMGAGLTHRPVEETIAAALRTEQELGLDRERRAGLSPARERELLAALR
jgi:2'-hydroxyisoflavone reductase